MDTRRRMSGLVTMRESKASGTQRSGRAARQGPGVAYRCLSEADWASLPEHTPPEVATSDLTSAVLALIVWGGDEDLLPDPLPAGPKRQAIENLVALANYEERLREAAKQGFKRALVPAANAPRRPVEGIEVTGVARLEQALAAAF